MNSRKLDKEIIKELSEKWNLDKRVIEEIVMSQFLCAKQNLESGTIKDPDSFKNIRFRKLFALLIRKNKLKNICQ